MQNINKNLQAFTEGFMDSQAGFQAELIGRTITAINPEDPRNTIEGKVKSVRFENGLARSMLLATRRYLLPTS